MTEFLCLKIAIGVLGQMREGVIFAEHYGTELRKAGKLMIIQVVVTFVVGTVLVFMFVPELAGNTSTSVTLNLGGLFTAAFVYLASHLLDYGYHNCVKETQPVYTDFE